MHAAHAGVDQIGVEKNNEAFFLKTATAMAEAD